MEGRIVLRFLDRDHKTTRARELEIPDGVHVPMIVLQLAEGENAVEIDVDGEHPLDVQVKDSDGRLTPLDPIWPGHHIRFTT